MINKGGTFKYSSYISRDLEQLLHSEHEKAVEKTQLQWDTRSIFKRSLKDLNSELSFS